MLEGGRVGQKTSPMLTEDGRVTLAPSSVVMPLSVLARGTRVATSIGIAPDLYKYRRREWQLALGWLSGMARQLSCSGHHQL